MKKVLLVLVLMFTLLISSCVPEESKPPKGKYWQFDNVVFMEYFPYDSTYGYVIMRTKDGIHKFSPVDELHVNYGTVFVTYNERGRFEFKNTVQ